MTNCYLSDTYCCYLPSYQLFYPKQSLLRGRIIAGISSKSEVLSQLRAKEDSYTILKDGTSQRPQGHETSSHYKNGPWVHITVEYTTSTANFCPFSLSNSFLRASMSRGKKRRENCFDLKVWLLLGNSRCASHTLIIDQLIVC